MEDQIQAGLADEAKPAPEAQTVETTEEPTPAPEPAEAPTETEGEESETPPAEGEQPDNKEQARQHYEKRWEQKVAERDTYIAQLEQTLKDSYVNEGDDPTEQRLRAVEADRYVEKVTTARQAIVNDHQRVAQDPELAIFNPSSKEFDPEVYEGVMETYANGYLQTDQSGEIVGSRVPLYSYLKQQATLLNKATQAGARKGQQAEATMRSAAVTPSATAPRPGAEDPIMKALSD